MAVRGSPEWRAKISAGKKGKKQSADHREKISAALRGRSPTPEHRANVSKALKGIPWTADLRAKRVGIKFNLKLERPCEHCGSPAYKRWCNTCTAGRGYQLLPRYGISNTDYETMRAAQNDACAICERSFTTLKPKLIHVDHDHKSGRVRGIVCHECNQRLVAIDDEQWNERALRYLKRDGQITFLS